jgi:hypothetical protein
MQLGLPRGALRLDRQKKFVERYVAGLDIQRKAVN